MPRCLARAFVAVAAALSLAVAAHAQPTATVTGVVTTREDGLPLPGATVAIESLGLSAVTDAQGRYRLEVPAAAVGQTVEVKATVSALTPRTVQIRLVGDVTHDFSLGLGFHEEITVGSRAAGAEAEKAVPVDIITARQIESLGTTETMQVLQALAPSFNFPRPTIADGTDSIRPATLRGLGPDQVLVLVNGKRRHQSALVHVNGTIGRGATGVDMNAIPVSAIERIEILRDGAAAQYGSDAIAGVINIVLKSGPSPLSLSARGGRNFGTFAEASGAERDIDDGGTLDFGGNYGFRLGRGSLSLTAEYRYREGTNRAGWDTRPQTVNTPGNADVPGPNGDVKNNAVPQPNTHWGDSEERDVMTFLNADVPLGASETTAFYAFGSFSRRRGVHGGNYRRAIDATDWPQIYPLGFLPLIEPTIKDTSATAGVRGARSGWFWDLSAQYGRNRMDYDVTNSLNVSLGPTIPPNHPEFYSGGFAFNQLVANLDLRREVQAGLAGPLNVAFGAEFRNENYEIFEGEPDSWRDAGAPNQFGARATPGAQVFPGFRPSNVVDASRHNVAAYVDLEGDVLDPLRVGVAGRFENYSDFGSTWDGKLTARLEATKRLVLRGAVSTGFRAPSLAQSYFSTVSTNFTLVGGTFVPVEVGTFTVGSPQARVLGAQDLQPESSVHYSGGVVLTPIDGLDITADVYQIRIEDRIVFSGNFTGGPLTTLLAPFGASGARYFTNAIDTKTRGLDLIADYKRNLGSSGNLRLQASYNRTQTRLLRIAPTPPALSSFLQQTAFENILFNDTEVRRFTCGQPGSNLRLTADWSRGAWAASVKEIQHGHYCTIEDRSSTSPTYVPQRFNPEWFTNFEVSYRRSHYTIGIGAENLFNKLPEHHSDPIVAFSNIRTFPRNAPFGYNGRYLYGKASVRF
jgi:iron complex outermembrane receptor protein